ncbi:MAG: RsmE family RNA methyltransferase [Aquificaceae bacterium]|jgi:16S rRNA (uracil1498-N3)-methyltransferase|nr:RsmE family RNA methyltransferase [Aquificaceae bacterium]MDM7267152.1 RsmE family RNA methyltransferase [Aquificaceae bacterium]QWK12209.1 MAG: RsmE family RNA methyltransferase [Aquificota bacterium]HAV39954.1 hypothetical protein [Aquificaceae bacterium]HCO38687.1 hypothetical protein [Aquificaceae bacterium]
MERLICAQREGSLLKISNSEFKHLKALRLKEGERLEVYCEDKLYLAVISQINKDYALCSILEEIEKPPTKPTIVVYQCIPIELSLMDEVIDRVSQAGAFKLAPVICKRGFKEISKIKEKMERWRRISLASFKQCKRPRPMEIDSPVKLTDLYPREEVSLVLDNFGGSLSIKDIDLSRESYGIVVGPEGGFSQEEVELLKNRGFLTLILKPYIYRSEMAGAVATALIMNLHV